MDRKQGDRPTGTKGRSRQFRQRRGPGPSRRARRTGHRYLFDEWDEIADRLHRAKRVALLLDFDGTLVEVRPRPGMVRLGEPVRRVLRKLARSPRVVPAIISGRRRADLRRRVGVAGVRYKGLYGWDRGNAREAAGPRVMRQIRQARGEMQAALKGLPGIWVEDKGLTFAIHYRGASRAAVRRANRIVRARLRGLGTALRVFYANKYWDVAPRMIHGKGAAVKRLLRLLPKGTLAIYAGDDTTDESAFRAIGDGIGVCVGRARVTDARYRLRNPKEVLRFLEKLEAEV